MHAYFNKSPVFYRSKLNLELFKFGLVLSEKRRRPICRQSCRWNGISALAGQARKPALRDITVTRSLGFLVTLFNASVDRTVLCHAVLAGHVERLATLLHLGADPNQACASGGFLQPLDERGSTASHHLASAIHLDTADAVQMADSLQQHGANPDQPSCDGSTPLGLVSRMVWTDLVRHLLQSGARQLGTRWCDTWTTPGCPVSIQVRILDQTLKSALGQASQLRD